jgi:hypothetical protein
MKNFIHVCILWLLWFPTYLRAVEHELTAFDIRTLDAVQSLSDQQRSQLKIDPLLCQLARQRASDMASKQYFGAVSPEGVNGNGLLERGGWKLPANYALNENSVMALYWSNGFVITPQAALQTLLEDPSPKAVLFAPPNLNPHPPEVQLVHPKIVTPKPFGSLPLTYDGWKRSSWFGLIKDARYPWILHQQHGWLFVKGKDESSVHLYSKEMRWLWTKPEKYPYFYRTATKSWIYYKIGSVNPLRFYDFKTKKWENH